MQGQTKSQLQVSTYCPLMFHAGVAIALPQSDLVARAIRSSRGHERTLAMINGRHSVTDPPLGTRAHVYASPAPLVNQRDRPLLDKYRDTDSAAALRLLQDLHK
jgi:hypothetical protein